MGCPTGLEMSFNLECCSYTPSGVAQLFVRLTGRSVEFESEGGLGNVEGPETADKSNTVLYTQCAMHSVVYRATVWECGHRLEWCGLCEIFIKWLKEVSNLFLPN